jgi:beta-glucosidase
MLRSMYRAALLLAMLQGVSIAHAAPVAGDCPALPRRFPLPREASAENLNSDDWRARVDALDKRLATNTNQSPEVVFVGDSITEYWDPGMLHHFFGRYSVLNLGISSDFTQGALWRFDHGQWGNLKPKVAVLLEGTNNLAYASRPEDVALGLAEITRYIHARSPTTKVLILGILPRAATNADPMRALVAQVNGMVRNCADNQTTFFADPGRFLVDADGVMTSEISQDLLHPTPVGYAILGMALEPEVRRLLGKK